MHVHDQSLPDVAHHRPSGVAAAEAGPTGGTDTNSLVITALVAGLLAGYGIAIPVGAIGAYLVALTARTSWKVGAGAALGIATADGVYAVIAMIGGSALTPVLEPIMTPLRWASALVLVVLAIRGAATAITTYRAHRLTPVSSSTPISPARAYAALLGMTLLNPMTVIYFAALVLGGSSSTTPNNLARGIFVLAAFIASASWQLLLAGSGALLGRTLTGPRGKLVTALASSALITALAIRMVVAA